MVTLGIERNNPDYFAGQGDERGSGRRLRLAPVQDHPHRKGPGVLRRRRHRHIVRSSRHFPHRHGHQERHHRGRHPGARCRVEQHAAPPSPPPRRKCAKPRTPSSIASSSTSIPRTRCSASACCTSFTAILPISWSASAPASRSPLPRRPTASPTKYVHPQQFAILVVGNQAEFGKPLSTLGPVTPLDITIPPPGAPAGSAASRSRRNPIPRRERWWRSSSTPSAAPTSWTSVKALHQKLVSTQHTPQGSITFDNDLTIQFPDRLRAAVTPAQLPGEMLIVVSPSSAFMTMPGSGTHEMPASMKQDRLNILRRDWMAIAQHVDDPAYVFSLGGTEKVGDTEAQVVQISGNGISVQWALDPQTARLLQVSYQDVGQRGPVHRVIAYSDWRPVDGLTVPFKRTITENGRAQRDRADSNLPDQSRAGCQAVREAGGRRGQIATSLVFGVVFSRPKVKRFASSATVTLP